MNTSRSDLRMVSLVVATLLLAAGAGFAQAPQQSTTGPVPPPGAKPSPLDDGKAYTTIPGVPEYLWRHGCGPTAVGMVVGYWDGNGYPALIPGNASTQTAAVDQAIASGGSSGSPNPPGSELHWEDYARPEDAPPGDPVPVTDDYASAPRPAHTDDCLADYMYTSRWDRDFGTPGNGNYYGWSWSSDISPSFSGYVNQQVPAATAAPAGPFYAGSSLTFSLLMGEINAGRPMVFLL